MSRAQIRDRDQNEGGTPPYNILLPDLWHDDAMSEKPELIAKLRVGSIVSGECSLCHEVIVVQDPGAGASNQLSETLRQAFEEHLQKEPRGFVV